MPFFAGKYPILTKSLSVFSVTMEGTQLHEVTVFGGMVKSLQDRKNLPVQIDSLNQK